EVEVIVHRSALNTAGVSGWALTCRDPSSARAQLGLHIDDALHRRAVPALPESRDFALLMQSGEGVIDRVAERVVAFLDADATVAHLDGVGQNTPMDSRVVA